MIYSGCPITGGGLEQQEMWIIELQLFVLSVAIDLCAIHTLFSFTAPLFFSPPTSLFSLLVSSFVSKIHQDSQTFFSPESCTPLIPKFLPFLHVSTSLPLFNSPFSASPLSLLRSVFAPSAFLPFPSAPTWVSLLQLLPHVFTERHHTWPSGPSWSVFAVHRCSSRRWRIHVDKGIWQPRARLDPDFCLWKNDYLSDKLGLNFEKWIQFQ